MIDRELPELSVRRQCELLKVSRSGLYYEPEPTSPDELALMRRTDELHLKYPFYGSRRLSDALRKEGREANRKRIQRLMRLMGLEAIAPKPTTSEPHPEHVRYPYLLRGLAISRVNQVWATDITYMPMKAGFVHLVTISDRYSRRVLLIDDNYANRLRSPPCQSGLAAIGRSRARGDPECRLTNIEAAPSRSFLARLQIELVDLRRSRGGRGARRARRIHRDPCTTASVVTRLSAPEPAEFEGKIDQARAEASKKAR